MDDKLHANALELRGLMGTIFKSTHQAMEKRLSEEYSDISRLQFSIMMMISHTGPQTISELSKKIGVDPSTLVPSVDALERKGFAVRGRDPKDRRRVPLSLTDKGVELTDKVKVVSDDDPMLMGLRDMHDDDVRQLLTLLCKLIHNMPDSESMIEQLHSRLSAYGIKDVLCKQQE